MIFGTPAYNVIPIKLRAAVRKRGCPSTAHLDGLNCDILQHKKESGETLTTAFIDSILDLARRDS